MKRNFTVIALLTGLTLTVASQFALAQPEDRRAIGDSRFIAAVPPPGYPEGVVVKRGRVYVSGPAAFGVPGNFVPSTIHVYDERTGAFINDIAIQGQPPGLHAESCIAADDNGNLYVLDEQLGVVKIDTESGQQTIYAAPFFPVFTSAYHPPAPVLINDLAFDKKGFLYITDSFQATIWRVPPGGGVPQVWYQSSKIDAPFGPNGIRVDPKSETLYFDVTFDTSGQGSVYRLPLIDHPADSDLTLFHTFEPGAGPDGFAFGASGKLYVALAGSSQIAVLREDGSEEARFSGPARKATDPQNPLPWANPANISFDDEKRTLIVTNHAGLIHPPDPSLFAIFDLYVDDHAAKLFGPRAGENSGH